jgi:hypothetical protein
VLAEVEARGVLGGDDELSGRQVTGLPEGVEPARQFDPIELMIEGTPDPFEASHGMDGRADAGLEMTCVAARGAVRR